MVAGLSLNEPYAEGALQRFSVCVSNWGSHRPAVASDGNSSCSTVRSLPPVRGIVGVCKIAGACVVVTRRSKSTRLEYTVTALTRGPQDRTWGRDLFDQL